MENIRKHRRSLLLPTVKSIVQSVQPFQAYEIVCLEHESTRLYGEVIQVVAPRQVCWVRPLMMGEFAPEDDTVSTLYDLRQGSDLVLPCQWFRPALDTEVIPLLIQLEALGDRPLDNLDPHRRLLNRFLHQKNGSETPS